MPDMPLWTCLWTCLSPNRLKTQHQLTAVIMNKDNIFRHRSPNVNNVKENQVHWLSATSDSLFFVI